MTVIFSNKEKSLQPRQDLDFYPTNIEFCRATVNKLFDCQYLHEPVQRILDPGCGSGNWGKAVREKLGHYVNGDNSTFANIVNIDGIDIKMRLDDYYKTGVGYLEEYDHLTEDDFLTFEPEPSCYLGEGYDLIIGNPPYRYAEKFIEKSMKLLKPTGTLVFLLRLAFLESMGRFKKYYSTIDMKPDYVWVSPRRLDFFRELGLEGSGDYKAMGIFIWNKRHVNWVDDGIGGKPYTELDWIYWDYER